MLALFSTDAKGKVAERFSSASYPSEKAALDAEEDYCYDILEAGGEPQELAVCEINEKDEVVRVIA